jgi:hypothetical protein
LIFLLYKSKGHREIPYGPKVKGPWILITHGPLGNMQESKRTGEWLEDNNNQISF